VKARKASGLRTSDLRRPGPEKGHLSKTVPPSKITNESKTKTSGHRQSSKTSLS